ncbi:MAG TPA: plastocyanin/azurin family copper-binding protein [Solirubrobacterales bacterium]
MKKVAALLVLVLASIALVACGSSGNDENTSTANTEASKESKESTSGGAANAGGKKAGGATETLEFEADPEGALAYTTTEATAKAGKVDVEFNNPQALTHDVAIEDSNGEVVGQTELIASSSDSTTVNLKPGTYTFFCTVPGHREAGMEGTLTVK